MTVDLVLGIARGFVGTKESPANSNNVIFNTHFYGREVSGSAYAWCAAYVWDVFRLAGASGLYYGGGKTASCTTLLDYAKRNGLYVAGGYKRGDIILYSWSGSKTIADHVGICTADQTGDTISTVEGNTAVGNDSDGGEVMERVRPISYIVGGYRPLYALPAPTFTYADFEGFMARYLTMASTGDTHSAWATDAIDFVTRRGIINGGGNGDFGWEKLITREAVAQIIYNLHK